MSKAAKGVGVVLALLLTACGGSGTRSASGGEATDVVVPEPVKETEPDPGPVEPSVRSSSGEDLSACRRDPKPETTHRAKGVFQKAVTSYSEGRYVEAAEGFSEAYLLSCAPALLFNLARARESSGNYARAIEVYELYLEETPDGSHAGMVQERLKRLRKR